MSAALLFSCLLVYSSKSIDDGTVNVITTLFQMSVLLCVRWMCRKNEHTFDFTVSSEISGMLNKTGGSCKEKGIPRLSTISSVAPCSLGVCVSTSLKRFLTGTL